MAEWIRHLTTDQEIPGSSPGRVDKKFLPFLHKIPSARRHLEFLMSLKQ